MAKSGGVVTMLAAGAIYARALADIVLKHKLLP